MTLSRVCSVVALILAILSLVGSVPLVYAVILLAIAHLV